mmetsp:Transcript_132469/g.264353  ORF Transcript_132469/g.264353 Transcript_132469/m.264353 type:complete len:152 (+) Transcript_132469:71-526(+)
MVLLPLAFVSLVSFSQVSVVACAAGSGGNTCEKTLLVTKKAANKQIITPGNEEDLDYYSCENVCIGGCKETCMEGVRNIRSYFLVGNPAALGKPHVSEVQCRELMMANDKAIAYNWRKSGQSGHCLLLSNIKGVHSEANYCAGERVPGRSC